MIRKICLVIVIAAVSLLAGCAHSGRLDVKLADNVAIPKRKVLVFFIDGMRKDILEELIRKGEATNIKRYLIDRGCYVENAVTCIPSITYAVTASMQTGKFPSHTGILGNKWFDRNSGVYRSYMFIKTYQLINDDLLTSTIFDLLNDKYTVTIQTACKKGATRPIDNWMSSGIDWFFHQRMMVDKLVAIRFELIAQCSRSAGHWPDYIFAYFPAVDEIGHKFGANSKQYRRAIINVDEQIGRICRALEENHLLDNYYLILVSDHGHVPVDRDKYWSPEDFVRNQLKIKFVGGVFGENADFCARQKFLRQYRLVIVNGGYRRASFYLRTGKLWSQLPSFEDIINFTRKYAPAFGSKDLFETLAAVPAIEMVAVRKDANSVRVVTADGRADVVRKIIDGRKYYAYKPIKGNPLRYSHKLIAGGYFDADKWLALTCDSEFPDFVPQIVEFFDSPRAGDIVVFAARGWDFSKTDLGGHGSVIRDDMIVPFIFAGPGISHKTIKAARVVDLVPTVLDMLGCSGRIKWAGTLDGKSLLKKLH